MILWKKKKKAMVCFVFHCFLLHFWSRYFVLWGEEFAVNFLVS